MKDWDVIILQRAAPGKSGSGDQWSDDMANNLSFIISYIKENVSGDPQIYFNSGFFRLVGVLDNRKKQYESVERIISTSRMVYEQFGIEIIPSAIAIQNARNTCLSLIIC